MKKIIIGIILILIIVLVIYCVIDSHRRCMNTTDISYYAGRRASPTAPPSFFQNEIPKNAEVISYLLYVDYSYNDEMLVLSFSDLNDLREFVKTQIADYKEETLVIRESPYQEGYTEYFSDQHFPYGRYINDEKWEHFFELERTSDDFFHGTFSTMEVSEEELTVAIFDIRGKFATYIHIPSYVEYNKIPVENNPDFQDEIVFSTEHDT